MKYENINKQITKEFIYLSIHTMCMINKKDVISINQQFDAGNFNNESSLDYSLINFKRNIAWTKQLAFLLRAILVDHVFEEGNKRTACALLITIIETKGYEINEKNTAKIITSIILKNIISINKIQRMIENAITKK